MNFIKNNKSVAAGIGLVGFAVVAWLAFSVFGVHTKFIDNEVNEDGPIFASGAVSESDDNESVDVDGAEDDTEVEQLDESDVAETSSEETTTSESTEPVIRTVASGPFSGSGSYSTSGRADVITDGSQRFLRFEDFEVDNGPDLKVYLRASDGEFINLGDLKGNIGSQNYEIPSDADLDRFNSVDIWCQRFSVGFGSAPLG